MLDIFMDDVKCGYIHGCSIDVGWSSWTQYRCGMGFMDVI